MRTGVAHALAVGCFLLPASDAGAQHHHPVIRDSGTVRIAEYATRPRDFRETALQPAHIRIGGHTDDVAQEIDSRNPFLTMVRLNNGDFVLNDWASIKWYDAQGGFKFSRGRPGKGPAEFTQLRSVCPFGRGDTIVAIDYSDRRLSVWSATGDHVQSLIPLGLTVPEPCIGDGSLLRLDPATRSADGRTADFERVTLDGRVLATFSGLPVESYGPGIPVLVTLNAGPHGVLVADGRSAEFRSYGTDGRLRSILRFLDGSEGVARSAVRDSLEAWRLNQLAATSPVPAYRRAFIDSHGWLWIQGFIEKDRWAYFDGNLIYRGATVLPGANRPGFRLVAVLGDDIVIRSADDMGAPVLTVHKFRRESP